MPRQLPMTKSQIEALGVRLVRANEPRPEDLQTLHELLPVYGEILAEAVVIVRENLDVAPTARVKSTGTILEKLRRDGGSWLKSLDDIAGMRIVGDFDRNGQDELVGRLVELFRDGERTPKVVDRRDDPSYGYRAVHVVVFVGGLRVEIQARTALQHEWAELFEKLADRIGRGIRYGEPPSAQLKAATPELGWTDEALDALPGELVNTLIEVSDMIDDIECAEQVSPGAPAVTRARHRTTDLLTRLRGVLDGILTVPR